MSAFPPLPESAPWRTMPELVATAARRGARPWLTARSADGGTHTVTYEQLPGLVARAAHLLFERGLEPGQAVGIYLDNRAGLEAVVLHHVIHWCGGVTVPVNARFPAPELRKLLLDAGITVLVSALDLLRVASAAVEDLPVKVLDLTPGLPALTGRRPELPAARVGEHDLADLLYTSGTSGAPKGVEFTHANVVACGLELVPAYGLREDDVYQSAVPWFSSTGSHTNPMSVLAAGAHFVLEPPFDQAAAVPTMRRMNTTVYFGVPSMYVLLLRDADLSGAPASLRTLVTGGSVMTAAGVADVHAAFPGRGLVNSYGQTEAGPGGTVVGPADIAAKPQSVGGRGNGPWTSFRVAGAEGGTAGPGEVGEILLRSPAVMRGYRGRAEETRETLRDGWLHTGDLGRVDEDGYLFYVDRMSETVIRGGFNISTVEVEAAMLTYPGVREAAVVGVPHQVLGEDLRAFVVAGDVLNVKELQRFLAASLADYKVPRHIVIVSGLPRNAMGKVVKNELVRGS